jgi:hypothetical protein
MKPTPGRGQPHPQCECDASVATSRSHRRSIRPALCARTIESRTVMWPRSWHSTKILACTCARVPRAAFRLRSSSSVPRCAAGPIVRGRVSLASVAVSVEVRTA